MGSTPISGMVCHKVTIRPRPGFSGQFRFLTTCPGKNCSALQFSRDAHLSRFWLGVPDMSLFSHICSRMLTLRWLKISSDFIFVYEKNRWRPGLRASASDPLGSTRRSPDPQVGPRRLAPVALALYNSRLRRSSRIAVPKLWLPLFVIPRLELVVF